MFAKPADESFARPRRQPPIGRTFGDKLRCASGPSGPRLHLTRQLFVTAGLLSGGLVPACVGAQDQPFDSNSFAAPSEFEPQEYIWLSWFEKGNLGSGPGIAGADSRT